MNKQFPPEFRQFSATQFRNILKQSWSTADQQSKDYIHNNILPAIFSSPPEVSRLLLEVVDVLLRYDYPKQWRSLLQVLKKLVSSDEFAIRKEFLFLLQLIARRFRVLDSNKSYKRQMNQYSHIIEELFVPFQIKL